MCAVQQEASGPANSLFLSFPRDTLLSHPSTGCMELEGSGVFRGLAWTRARDVLRTWQCVVQVTAAAAGAYQCTWFLLWRLLVVCARAYVWWSGALAAGGLKSGFGSGWRGWRLFGFLGKPALTGTCWHVVDQQNEPSCSGSALLLRPKPMLRKLTQRNVASTDAEYVT